MVTIFYAKMQIFKHRYLNLKELLKQNCLKINLYIILQKWTHSFRAFTNRKDWHLAKTLTYWNDVPFSDKSKVNIYRSEDPIKDGENPIRHTMNHTAGITTKQRLCQPPKFTHQLMKIYLSHDKPLISAFAHICLLV